MGMVNFLNKAYSALKLGQADKAHIAHLQKQRLQRLLFHAVSKSEFYHKLYKGIDVARCQLRDLPVVTKSIMMENYDRFVTDERLKLREIRSWKNDKKNDGKMYLDEFIPIYTSGSSGETALVIYHRKALEQVQASLFARSSLANAKRPSYQIMKILVLVLLFKKVRMASITIPRGSVYPIFDIIPTLHQLFVNRRLLSSADPIDKIVDQLNEFQPDCLISYSFLIALLAREQIAGRLNIKFNHPISFVAGASEPLTEHTQDLVWMAWNKRIQNIYGAVECYTMATSCQEFGRLHVMSDLCVIENVDHEYNPVPKGQYGEKLLLTNLFNFVQPMIRYEIEDIIGFEQQDCECGITLPTLLPVRGRSTEFLYFSNPQGGYERLHPYHLMVALCYVNGLQQYQIVQTARNDLTLYYVPQEKALDIEKQVSLKLKEALARSGLDRLVNLKLEVVDSIARDKRTGKFKWARSLGNPEFLDSTNELS
jgi:phenylacetate-coenzyme A ligase PaaK-like adenylate-forming protein